MILSLLFYMVPNRFIFIILHGPKWVYLHYFTWFQMDLSYIIFIGFIVSFLAVQLKLINMEWRLWILRNLNIHRYIFPM